MLILTNSILPLNYHWKLSLTYTFKLQIAISISIIRHHIHASLKGLWYTMKLWELVGYAHLKKTLKDRNQMKLWFLNRGYPKWLIDKEVEKVKFPCTSRKRDTKMKGIPLVITYHPLLKDFASVVRKHLYILYFSL